MHHEEFQVCACTALRKASRAVTRLYDERLVGHGMTITQFAILRNLWRAEGELPLSRLADRLAMDRTSLYRTLTPVERAGWVTIETGSGRAKLARLTDDGRAAMHAAEDDWNAAQADLLKEVDTNEWRTLLDTLNRLVEAAQMSVAP